MLEETIKTTLDSFDFSFCISANILTYMVIMILQETKWKLKLTTWFKRVILVIICLLLGTIYYIIGVDTKLIINSSILAPVAWSWIFRPLCDKFKLNDIKKDINKI